jgi:hypothetical protein
MIELRTEIEEYQTRSDDFLPIMPLVHASTTALVEMKQIL